MLTYIALFMLFPLWAWTCGFAILLAADCMNNWLDDKDVTFKFVKERMDYWIKKTFETLERVDAKLSQRG